MPAKRILVLRQTTWRTRGRSPAGRAQTEPMPPVATCSGYLRGPGRRWTIVVIASLLLNLAPAQLARAATETISIGNAGAAGELSGGFTREIWNGVKPEGWALTDQCDTGGFTDELEPDSVREVEYRFALEFPLVALPDEATITSAALGLGGGDPSLPTAMYGYAGDGSITSPDADVLGTPVLVTPDEINVRQFHDVTELLTADVIAAGWAGFSIREEPFQAQTPSLWDCPYQELFPILTIEYSVPDPEPTPAPTPAIDALPNTAADPATPGGGWVAIAVGAMLAATLLSMAGRSRGFGSRPRKPPIIDPEYFRHRSRREPGN